MVLRSLRSRRTPSPHRLSPMEILEEWQRVLERFPDVPYLHLGVDASRVGACAVVGDCVAWKIVRRKRGDVYVSVLGADARNAVAALESLSPRADVGECTVSAVLYDELPVQWQAHDAAAWSWWWTTTLPPVRSGESSVVALAPDDPRIDPLLAHSDSAWVFTGDRRALRWWGIEDGSELVACLVVMEEPPGIPHLASVCTHPSFRGRGLSKDLCSAVTRVELHAGSRAVVLETYTANTSAANVYSAVGFVCGGEFRSGSWADTTG